MRRFYMDYDITFPADTINYTNAGGIILISVLIVAAAILMIRYSANILPAIAGLLIYMVLGVAGIEIVTMAISVIPVIGDFLIGSSVAFCITRALIFALLVHLARWLVLKFSDRKGDMELGNALIGGWGIALGQAIISGMDILYVSTLGNTINSYGMDELVSDMSAEEISNLIDAIKQVSDIPGTYFLFKGINCAVDVLFHIFAVVLLYAIVKKGLDKKWYLIVGALTFVMNLITLFYDYRAVSSYLALAFIKLITLAAVFALALNIDTRYLNGELRSFDKMKDKKKMPKYDGSLKNK
jgi:hypothetical protein